MQFTGGILDYFVVFFAGVLVSFTPCIYPVLPLTAGFIAGFNTDGTRWSGFVLSLLYVLGIAITYCTLAVIASLTGQIFGQWQNQPAVYLIISGFLIFFALALFDIISVPMFQITAQHHIKGRHLGTVILFGMVAGLMVGPCTSPVLGTLLIHVGAKQNIFYAASLLFVFSYGVGFSLIIVGTFSGILERLPRSGKWMVWIKKFCGMLILISAGVLIWRAVQIF